MSYRELVILETLARYEMARPRYLRPNGSVWVNIEQVHDYWNTFIGAIESLAGVRLTETSALLDGLPRTGFFEQFVVVREDGDVKVGHLTPRYYRLRDLIADADSNVLEPRGSAEA